MLNKKQMQEIREQLKKQLSNFPPEQRRIVEKYLDEMSDEYLEDFLIKNKMIEIKKIEDNDTNNKEDSKKNKNEKDIREIEQEKIAASKCTFCLISENQLRSYILEDNSFALAVLEINPISRAHTLIIPKKHVKAEKIPSQAFSLAKKITSRIKSKFKPKRIDMIITQIFGHGVINLLPVYENETLESPRKKISEEELISVQSEIVKKIEPKKTNKKKSTEKNFSRNKNLNQDLEIKKENLLKYPKRIP